MGDTMGFPTAGFIFARFRRVVKNEKGGRVRCAEIKDLLETRQVLASDSLMLQDGRAKLEIEVTHKPGAPVEEPMKTQVAQRRGDERQPKS